MTKLSGIFSVSASSSSWSHKRLDVSFLHCFRPAMRQAIHSRSGSVYLVTVACSTNGSLCKYSGSWLLQQGPLRIGIKMCRHTLGEDIGSPHVRSPYWQWVLAKRSHWNSFSSWQKLYTVRMIIQLCKIQGTSTPCVPDLLVCTAF